MKRDVNFYVGRANVKFEAGFTTKSAQKDSLSDLGIAYSLLAGNIRSLCLIPPNEARTDEQDNVYWSIPFNLHQWRAKHTALVLGVFPEAVSITVQIEELVELRNTIKSAEIVRVERIANEKVVALTKTIHEIIELRKQQFERGMEIYEVFGSLPVSMNWHYVTNQFGTSFIRVFYYMAGKLTPLSMICYIMEQNELENA